MTPAPRFPFGFRVIQRLLRVLLRLFTRLDISGLEHLPEHGPAILTPNHVVWFDVVPLFAYTRTPLVSFSAEKWGRHWLMKHFFRHFGRAIFVERGEIDRNALTKAMQALKEGEVLGVAPEGTRSYTGVLQQGHDGAAWLASRTNADLIPFVMWGHEHVSSSWKRLRRPRIYVRIGESYRLPAEASKTRSRDLKPYTDIIMGNIAALLPPERRGPYA